MEALQGLPQPEDRIDLWQRMCDEITDTDLEAVMDGAVEGDGLLRRKRPDAWAVNWGARKVFILEYTRPYDRAEDALQATDARKIARYTPLRDRMAQLLPGWTRQMRRGAARRSKNPILCNGDPRILLARDLDCLPGRVWAKGEEN